MADTKLSDLAALTSVATGDLIPVVDVSDTSMAATGTNKKITHANLVTGLATSTDLTTHASATDTHGATGAIV